jgi:hypothetical protein
MRLVVLSFVVACTGCNVIPSRMASAQEAVGELNLNARFGRMAIVGEHISKEALETFTRHRRAWGTAVRVVDTEVLGLEPAKDETVNATVRVAWYRADEGDLQTTDLRQRWREDGQGVWRLFDEERATGAGGLIGDGAPLDERAKRIKPPDAHFPTKVLSGATP